MQNIFFPANNRTNSVVECPGNWKMHDDPQRNLSNIRKVPLEAVLDVELVLTLVEKLDVELETKWLPLSTK